MHNEILIIMEEQLEIQRQLRQSQEKYIYYILALCVSAIGFAVYITLDKSLNMIMIPLGLAIISWGISIYSGFRLLEISHAILWINNNMIEVVKGNNPISGYDPRKMQEGITYLQEEVDKASKIARKRFQLQRFCFILGMIFFIIWHVLVLYFKK